LQWALEPTHRPRRDQVELTTGDTFEEGVEARTLVAALRTWHALVGEDSHDQPVETCSDNLKLAELVLNRLVFPSVLIRPYKATRFVMAGFAFSPVAGVALLYFLPHKLVIPLLMFCSIIVQIATLAYLRRSLVWANLEDVGLTRRLAPPF
jgi:hypothetical protein